jgi:HEAT repeat protein
MNDRRAAVIIAGHEGDRQTVDQARHDPDPGVREAVVGALERLGALDDETLAEFLADPSPRVRRRAVEIAADRPDTNLRDLLEDPDTSVVEMAAWACGEHERVTDPTLERLMTLATEADDPLVREASAAALGAIGDRRGLDAIIAACSDRPAIRRRAVLALAPFLDEERATATLLDALGDRDWQVRQAAEDLCLAAGLEISEQR